MTEEQIKQNAEDYTNDHNWTWDDSGESRVDISAEISDAYITGAHSRDEEIEELKKQLAAMTRLKNSFAGGVDILDNDNKELQKELDKLRNPWA